MRRGDLEGIDFFKSRDSTVYPESENEIASPLARSDGEGLLQRQLGGVERHFEKKEGLRAKSTFLSSDLERSHPYSITKTWLDSDVNRIRYSEMCREPSHGTKLQ